MGYNLDMKRNIIKLRIVFWHILAFCVFFFVYRAVVPSGHISYVYNFNKENSFISKLTPEERLRPVENNSQKIIGDPVYFSLQTPRKFNNAFLEIEYKNNKSEINPIIETGILVDGDLWRYKLKPLDNYLLDKLSETWDFVESGDTCLFISPEVATTSYSSLDIFLKDPPPSNQIATYNYKLNLNYYIDNYSSSTEIYNFDKEIRGDYQILTYIDNEDLFFDFSFIDLNKNKDIDPVDIYLYYNDQIIESRHLDDDGIENDRGHESDLRNIDFNLVNMPTGSYKIEVHVGDDIVTKNIKTKQKKLSFLNKLWVSNVLENNFYVYTDGDIFHVKTMNPGSRQEIKFASSTLDLSETFKQYSRNLKASTTKILFQKGDIILAGNGVFSFGLDSLLNPRIKNIDSNFDINKTNIKYIVAKYIKPEKIGEYFSNKVYFDLSGAYREDSKYSFIISIPGLDTKDGDNYVEINKIKFDLFGLSLVEKIKTLFK